MTEREREIIAVLLRELIEANEDQLADLRRQKASSGKRGYPLWELERLLSEFAKKDSL